MPRIPDAYLDSVVYLYPSEAEAQDGKRLGGSGFLIGIHIPFEAPPKGFLVCVVTNKHIVDDGAMVVRINTRDGKYDVIALDGRQWFMHPAGDDIAICPIGLNHDFHKFRFISYNQFATREILNMFDVGPGDEIFVPGRFVGRDGKQRNTPTVRFGNIAQMPDEPLTVGGHAQECYLVEARSIPGYSGAPVFLHFIPEHPEIEYPDWMPNRPPKSNRPKIGFKIDPFLLGIDFCHMLDREKPRSDVDDQPLLGFDWHIRTNTGMMGVIPIWRVWDIVDGPEMKAIRETLAERLKSLSAAQQKTAPEN